MRTYIFTFKAGEVFEVNTDSTEDAWSKFYDNMRPLTQDQAYALLESVHTVITS